MVDTTVELSLKKTTMKLHAKKFAWAGAQAMGILYIICAAFVAVWPDTSLQLFGWLMHLTNVEQFAGDVGVTFGGFIGGLAQSVVYTYLFLWLLAAWYNRSARA